MKIIEIEENSTLSVEEIITRLLPDQGQAYTRFPNVPVEKVDEALRGIIDINKKPIDES